MTQTFIATLHHQGQTFTVAVPEDQAILDAAIAQGLDLPCSCYAGVCTTCAAQIVKGEVDQSQGMGIGGMGEELDAKGYILLCVAHPKSDVEIYTDKEQEVYSIRFGSSS